MCALLLVSLLWTQKTCGQKNNDEIDGLNAATPTLPMPSGPFGIGRIGYEWIDTSRPDTYSANPDTHRDLMVYLSYPVPRTDTGNRGRISPVQSRWMRTPRFSAVPGMRLERPGN
jgi:hypothetical protein